MYPLLKKPLFVLFIVCLLNAPVWSQPVASVLWQIGNNTAGNNDLFLGSAGYKNFKQDAFYIVGQSTAAKDWPYCHPGPDDVWAGGKQHQFAICFGLKSLPSDNLQLNVHLAGIGNSAVTLAVNLNGHLHIVKLPEGDGEAIFGNSNDTGYSFKVDLPASEFIQGNNKLSFINQRGSWLVYDWLRLTSTGNIKTVAVQQEVKIDSIQQVPLLLHQQQQAVQPLRLILTNTGSPVQASVLVNGSMLKAINLQTGIQQEELMLPAVTKTSTALVQLQSGNKVVAATQLAITPVPHLTIYVLPHSHNDIGYTEIQTAVEAKQINNLVKGIEYAERTKNYPKGARFVWNLEGAYAAELYLQRMNAEQKQAFFNAVKDGGVAINGMYVNTLTGLCRPEELCTLFKYGVDLSGQCKVPLTSAMISDVPGYTWGTVTAMAKAGIRYFSVAPNYFDRIGNILRQWENKPFYWLSPSGKDSVLVWIPYKGYALSHTLPGGLSKSFVENYAAELKAIKFPYDITYIRWSGHGDNAVPDSTISDFIKDWNSKYDWPKFIISSTNEAFNAFEKKYHNQLPVERGDWTGYWEDGAGSSAYQTAENRNSSLQLTQAGSLWAMLDAGHYPKQIFERAWSNIILYSEHTWGADESITRPLSQKTKEQWAIKKSYADSAAALTSMLIEKAISAQGAVVKDAVDIYNSNSFPQTNLVTIPAALSSAGDAIKDEAGNIITAQRLSTGELAFVAKNVLPFSSKRFFISQGNNQQENNIITIHDNVLDNGIIHVEIDKTSGAVKSLRNSSIANNFADSSTGSYLNDFLFLQGSDTAAIQHNDAVTISIKEQGPVLATLLIKANAPGCNSFVREVTVVHDLDYVLLKNIVDKKPAELNPNPGDYAWANKHGKESLNFGFPFHVKDGAMRINTPMAIIQPEKDQLAGACKNWMETDAWVDVSNADYGITWCTLDAPLIEVGGITANLLGGQTNPDVWRRQINPTQKLYSWALNNHWETNYRAYQDGIITYRYALQPHEAYNVVHAEKWAASLSQPLIVATAYNDDRNRTSLLQLSASNIIVQSLKPADDGNGFIVTLFNPTQQNQTTSLKWSVPVQPASYSNTAEEKLKAVNGEVKINAMDVVMIRVDKK